MNRLKDTFVFAVVCTMTAFLIWTGSALPVKAEEDGLMVVVASGHAPMPIKLMYSGNIASLAIAQTDERETEPVDTTPAVTAEDVEDGAVLKSYLERERGRLAEIERRRFERESAINYLRSIGRTEEEISTIARGGAESVADAANDTADIVEVRQRVVEEREERARREAEAEETRRIQEEERLRLEEEERLQLEEESALESEPPR